MLKLFQVFQAKLNSARWIKIIKINIPDIVQHLFRDQSVKIHV